MIRRKYKNKNIIIKESGEVIIVGEEKSYIINVKQGSKYLAGNPDKDIVMFSEKEYKKYVKGLYINYVIIDGAKYYTGSTRKKYTHAVVQSKEGKMGIVSLSGDAHNAEKAAAAHSKDCEKMVSQGFLSQKGYTFSVHSLFTETI